MVTISNLNGINKHNNTTMQQAQNTISLPQPKNLSELELLKDYSSYLMEQVSEMKLHPAHKENIKEILLKAIVQISILHTTSNSTSKTQSFLFRLLHKIAG